MRRGIVALYEAAGRNKCCRPASSILSPIIFQRFCLIATCSSLQPACNSTTTLRRHVYRASTSNQQHHQLADVQGRETSRQYHVHHSLSDCKRPTETKDLFEEKQEESWGAIRKQLADYCDQYGDCNVPAGWPDNRVLGQWVATQRKEKNKLDQGLYASITKERIASLD
jgi:hypothetical protein